MLLTPIRAEPVIGHALGPQTSRVTRSRSRRCRAAVAGSLLLIALVGSGCSTVAGPGPSICPSLLPGTSDALDDYFDLFVWQQRTYVAADNLPDGDGGRAVTERDLGVRVAAVTCNVYDWSALNGGLRAAPRPWPDGTATGLAVGTSLYELPETETRCALVARDGQELQIYVAADLDAPDLRPVCK